MSNMDRENLFEGEKVNTEKMREEFEAWAGDRGFCLDCMFFEEGNNYEDPDTRIAYEIWQASRAALSAHREQGVEQNPTEREALEVRFSTDDRTKWTVKDWYSHFGAWENDKGQLCFGSTIAFAILLERFHSGIARQCALSAHREQQEPGVTDTCRLDFILFGFRKVVASMLPEGRFDVYVEEGFMGEIEYPAVRIEGEWNPESAEGKLTLRKAIDLAITTHREQRDA